LRRTQIDIILVLPFVSSAIIKACDYIAVLLYCNYVTVAQLDAGNDLPNLSEIDILLSCLPSNLLNL